MAWYSSRCVILASSMSMLHCVAVGQTTSTETKWIEEADAHIQFASQWGVLAFVGGEQGQNNPYQQWYPGAGLGYRFKPFSMPHRQNIDPDKNYYLVVGVGYEHLDTGSSGKIENRITLDATPGYNFPGDLLLLGRTRCALKWLAAAH